MGFAQPRRRSIAVILNDPAHPLNQFVQNHGDFVRPAFVFGFIPPLGLFTRPFADAGCRLCRPQVVALQLTVLRSMFMVFSMILLGTAFFATNENWYASASALAASGAEARSDWAEPQSHRSV